MAYYEDLSKCDYFAPWNMLVAIGWLSVEHSYPKGAVSDDFLRKLVKLQSKAVQDPFNYIMLGFHVCDLCPLEKVSDTQKVHDARLHIGRRNLFIPAADDRVYVAPSTILHYIVEHNYCPPLEFQEAVLACPPMKSFKYYKQMRARGAVVWSFWTFLKNIHLG